MTAQARYEALSSDRNQFLQSAIDASKLTLPYLIKQDEDNSSHKTLLNPYQSVGAKGVVTLASKLMLALLPVQTSFFKLQVDETSLIGEGIDPKVRSDLDLSFSKIERTMMESIAASDDRVTVHQALKRVGRYHDPRQPVGTKDVELLPLWVSFHVGQCDENWDRTSHSFYHTTTHDLPI